MKKKIETLLKIEKFFVEQIWVYAIIIGSICLCAWIFDRWIESIMFVIAHIVIRRVFNKQFHLNKTALCLCLTLAIVWFSIPITLPLASSLLSSIPISFLICFFGYLAQDRVDLRYDVKKLDAYATDLVRKLTHKDVYAMTEDELYEHCRNCGLDEEDCKIAYFVVIERLQGRELYGALPYGEATIKRKRARIMKKIQEQPKNVTTIVEN